jgi:hypothetical protein
MTTTKALLATLEAKSGRSRTSPTYSKRASR